MDALSIDEIETQLLLFEEISTAEDKSDPTTRKYPYIEMDENQLHFGRRAHNARIINFICRSGKNFKDESSVEGDTILHVACRKNKWKLMRLILDHFANGDIYCPFISTTNVNGHTPLFIAASCGHKKIIEIMTRGDFQRIGLLDNFHEANPSPEIKEMIDDFNRYLEHARLYNRKRLHWFEEHLNGLSIEDARKRTKEADCPERGRVFIRYFIPTANYQFNRTSQRLNVIISPVDAAGHSTKESKIVDFLCFG
jgi:hypothetical protein